MAFYQPWLGSTVVFNCVIRGKGIEHRVSRPGRELAPSTAATLLALLMTQGLLDDHPQATGSLVHPGRPVLAIEGAGPALNTPVRGDRRGLLPLHFQDAVGADPGADAASGAFLFFNGDHDSLTNNRGLP